MRCAASSLQQAPSKQSHLLSNVRAIAQVVVRCRPLSKQELSDGRTSIINTDESKGQVQLSGKDSSNDTLKVFTFDQVYGMASTQREVFQVSAQPIVDSVMEGFNGTVFAYGQTGTGKTYTMEGMAEPGDGSQHGIMLNTFEHVFKRIQDDKGSDREYLVYISYLEIYNEEIRDLLCKGGSKLQLKEQPGRGVYIKDLKQARPPFLLQLAALSRCGIARHVPRRLGTDALCIAGSASFACSCLWCNTLCVAYMLPLHPGMPLRQHRASSVQALDRRAQLQTLAAQAAQRCAATVRTVHIVSACPRRRL